jgi:hypothetical protein
MSSADSAHATPGAASDDRKLIRVKGVRADPGGWVWVSELDDGWATFPDWGAGGRRFQWVGAVLLVVLIALQFPLVDNDWYLPLQVINGGLIVLLIIALWVVGQVTDNRKAAARRQVRYRSMFLAGGRDAVRAAVRSRGRTRTVSEMNILLSSIGREDPVFSKRRITKVAVDRRFLRTSVALTLTGGHSLTYRTRGFRGPVKLARVFENLQGHHA